MAPWTKPTACAALVLLAAGCAPTPAPPPPATALPAPPRDHAQLGLPEGAIPIGSDLYMLPVGEDAGGCAMYQLHSDGGLVMRSIHYRTEAGAFTLEREDAACDPTS
jgi:hypothetical protein